VEAKVAEALALSTAEGGGRGAGEPRMPSTRRRRPYTVGRVRRGRVRARGEGGGRGAGWPGLASLAGPVGWRRPASEQPPFLFFNLNFFSQTLSKFIWTILKSFSPFSPKTKVVLNQKPYNFALG